MGASRRFQCSPEDRLRLQSSSSARSYSSSSTSLGASSSRSHCWMYSASHAVHSRRSSGVPETRPVSTVSQRAPRGALNSPQRALEARARRNGLRRFSVKSSRKMEGLLERGDAHE